jgi:hypothetical protein
MDSSRAVRAFALGCLRLALLTCALLCTTATGALAANNTVGYTVSLALSAVPSPAQPANLGYHWSQHLDTTPPGMQPDTSPSQTIYFASPVESNGRYFPSCTRAAIDGMTALSAECQNAIVGTGTATIYAGQPGSSLANSVAEKLAVKLINGPAGSSLWMVVSSQPGAPVQITNRVLPGTIAAASDPYAFGIRFDVPDDLQHQLGLSLTVTDVDVTISGTPRQITSGAASASLSYLQATRCEGALPFQDTVVFKSTTGNQTTVSADGNAACTLGAFPDDQAIATRPVTTTLPLPGSPTRPASPKIDAPAGRLTAVAARNGSFVLPRVKITCPAAATRACDLTGQAKGLRRVRQKVAPGDVNAIRVQLTKAGRKALRQKRSINLSVRLVVTSPSGSKATKLVRVAVRPSGG